MAAEEFIGFCEESGLIRALGPLTMKLLNEDLARLRAAGMGGLHLSVNTLVTQLADRELAGQLTRWPPSFGLAGLTIEVTESVLLPDNSAALNLLAFTRRLGAQISVDDYGAGSPTCCP